MLRYILLVTTCFFLLGACRSSKKNYHAKPNPKRPTTSASKPAPKPTPKPASSPSKPSSTKPATPSAPTPVSVGDASNELVFVESERLSPVLEKAQKDKKPVMIVFTADWCAPCKVMKEEVFTQKPTFTYLNKNFINYQVDFDSNNGQTIAAIYEVKSLPTILFLDPQGVVLERKMGMATHSNLTMMGDAALKKVKKN